MNFITPVRMTKSTFDKHVAKVMAPFQYVKLNFFLLTVWKNYETTLQLCSSYDYAQYMSQITYTSSVDCNAKNSNCCCNVKQLDNSVVSIDYQMQVTVIWHTTDIHVKQSEMSLPKQEQHHNNLMHRLHSWVIRMSSSPENNGNV